MRIPPDITRSKVVVLTGAGASVPLGLFTTAQFLEDFRAVDYRRLSAVAHTKTALDSIFKEASDAGLDIEGVLDRLERRRDALDQLSLDVVFQRDVLKADRRSRAMQYSATLGVLIDAIRDKVIDHYSSVEADEAGKLYRPLFRDFRDWFRLLPDLGFTLPVFTLNYDVAAEVAAHQLSGSSTAPEQTVGQLPVRLVDGIAQGIDATERRWTRRAFEEYRESEEHLTVVLVKLHGSVRWGRRKHHDRPDDIVELTPGLERDPGQFETAVLYPTLGPKPIEQEPFHTGYRLLRACLRETHLLIVVGSTLRDAEVIDELRDALEENPDLHIACVGPHVEHEALSGLIGVASERLAAVRARFEVPRPKIEGEIPGGLMPREWLMGCLRKIAWEAYEVPQVAGGPYFGKTLVCDRAVGLARVGR